MKTKEATMPAAQKPRQDLGMLVRYWHHQMEVVRELFEEQAKKTCYLAACRLYLDRLLYAEAMHGRMNELLAQAEHEDATARLSRVREEYLLMLMELTGETDSVSHARARALRTAIQRIEGLLRVEASRE